MSSEILDGSVMTIFASFVCSSLVLSSDETIDGTRSDVQYLTDLGVSIPHLLQKDSGLGFVVRDSVEPFFDVEPVDGYLAGVLWWFRPVVGVSLDAHQLL
jgi:hypothetical protein